MRVSNRQLNKNSKFKVGDKVVCTWGLNRGKEFIIMLVISHGYSLKIADGSDDKYYGYHDDQLELVES